MWWRRREALEDLQQDIRDHLDQETADNTARGMSPDEARRRAHVKFGSAALAAEDVRAVWVSLWLEQIGQDLRHTVRAIRRQPIFAIAAVGMVGLAIALTTAMFTVVDALILRPVPFPDADRLVHVWMGNERGGSTTVDSAVLRAWRASSVLSGAEAATPQTVLIEAGESYATRSMAVVTPGLFELLGGVRPVRGRLFLDDEGAPGRDDRVLMSEDLWQDLFGGERPWLADESPLTESPWWSSASCQGSSGSRLPIPRCGASSNPGADRRAPRNGRVQ
jgi:hypothetical protein